MSNPNHSKHLQNHVAILLDASSSMEGRQADVIKTVDGQIKYLARRSQEMDQETRVSIYTFASWDNVNCVIFDRDVLRLPSIGSLYHINGNTALIDATLLAISDLKQMMVKYGDHAFLVYVLTDGEENDSRGSGRMGTPGPSVGVRSYLARSLKATIESLPENWTLAALVPGVNGKQQAIDHGFPRGNVFAWDISSDTGVEEAMMEVKTATDTYMVMRASGQSGTRTLFSTDATAVNAATIQAAGLQPLKPGTYDLIKVTRLKPGQGTLNKDKKQVWELADFLRHNGLKFVLGRNFYLLGKKERIAGDKEIAVRERTTNRVFVGAGVRAMIGLSDKAESVAPDKNPDYDIFVQSKSNNRHLFNGDEILVLK